MKYRSRLDIIAMVLQAIGDSGAKKTKIMYDAYLSYKQAEDYLRFLLDRGLIAKEGEDGRIYKLTDDGRTAISFIADIEKLVGVGGRRTRDEELAAPTPVKAQVRW